MIEIIVYVVMAITTGAVVMTCIIGTTNIEEVESEWIPVILCGILWPGFLVVMLSIIVFAIGVKIAGFAYKKITEKIK